MAKSNLIKVKLLKAAEGKARGQSLTATRAELKQAGLVEGEHFRVVGAWPAAKAPASHFAPVEPDPEQSPAEGEGEQGDGGEKK